MKKQKKAFIFIWERKFRFPLIRAQSLRTLEEGEWEEQEIGVENMLL